MLTAFLWILLGIALLYGGAEGLVRASSGLALRLGLTPLVIGLTVVAFGTSMPELVVSVGAALEGRGEIAVGNVVGSNIGNIGLILGLSALIRPPVVRLQLLRLDVPIMVLASGALVGAMWDGLIGRFEGALLLAALAGYTGFSIGAARRETRSDVLEEYAEGMPAHPATVGREVVVLVLGLLLLVAGAQALTRGAVEIASGLGIGELVIGLTIVAIGTSLPELATSLLAASRGEGDIAVGNVIGSNLFNVFGIMGAASLVRPLDAGALSTADISVFLGSALILVPLLRSGWTLSRAEGALLLAGYVAYIAFLIHRA